MKPYIVREWAPHERPMMPGSPSTPLHPWPRRLAFGFVGILVAITGSLGNALVTANLTNLQGVFGAFSNEVAWLPAVYVMTNISINLLLVKFRMQFGLRLFTEAFLLLYALVTFFHLFVNDLNSAIAVRAAHGAVAAALSSLGIYYMIQAFPAKHRLKALAIGISASQLAIPLARLFSAGLLELDEWRGLYLFELGLALICFGCVLMLKLPPGDRYNAFEKMDFVTFFLMAPGMGLLCAVISLGRYDWWTSTPWLGWALAGAIVLIVSAVLVEHRRKNPLLNVRWLSSGSVLRLGLTMVLMRIVLSEQNVGPIGFLQYLGLQNDQMTALSLAVLLGVIAGIATSALTIKPTQLEWPIVVALVLMIISALIDSQSNNLTRAPQMVVSQFMMGFAGALFVAPAMLSIIGSVVAEPRNLVSFVAVFGMSQNLGGLIGSALLGTFQVWREKYHSSLIADNLSNLDPLVMERINNYSAGLSATLGDATLRGAEGVLLLQAAATREANVLAYNDVYLLTAFIAAGTLIWLLSRFARTQWRARQARRQAARAEAASSEAPSSVATPAAKPAGSPEGS
ncbi:MFS transporter [Chimaeribacter coloradensis]|uniref:MFS transporter n=1 Tax=Chimaeribacter coloradensis TaxID=2060068 RepID=A0A2N5E195_9GAMM|nr:MFS transporter [Chimaeribacter coloradensis]PLR34089.1 MFS transporter [Chimaeribacter coloradensis]